MQQGNDASTWENGRPSREKSHVKRPNGGNKETGGEGHEIVVRQEERKYKDSKTGSRVRRSFPKVLHHIHDNTGFIGTSVDIYLWLSRHASAKNPD